MAILVIDDKEFEVPDGEKILDTIEENGIPIGCSNGVCGTCEIEVIEGMENLSELNVEEKDMGMENNKRLGCQCVINGGKVRINY